MNEVNFKDLFLFCRIFVGGFGSDDDLFELLMATPKQKIHIICLVLYGAHLPRDFFPQ